MMMKTIISVFKAITYLCRDGLVTKKKAANVTGHN